jgi:hypothetical protein
VGRITVTLDLLCESGGCGRIGTIHHRDRWLCRRCVEELDGQLGLGRTATTWILAGLGIGVLTVVFWALITTGPTPNPARLALLWAWVTVAFVLLVVAARLGWKGRR